MSTLDFIRCEADQKQKCRVEYHDGWISRSVHPRVVVLAEGQIAHRESSSISRVSVAVGRKHDDASSSMMEEVQYNKPATQIAG